MLFRAPAARVSGRIRWAIIDEATGREERTGRGRNLITDHGLDEFAHHTDEAWRPPRSYLHLGDGSGAPANGDTSLDNETHETTSNGGFGASRSEERDTQVTPNVARMESTVTRYQSFASAATVSEFGFSRQGGNLSIRELFRDESENPVSITIQAGKALRVDHTLTVEIPLDGNAVTVDVEQIDAEGTVTGTDQHTARIGYFHTGPTALAKLFDFFGEPENLSRLTQDESGTSFPLGSSSCSVADETPAVSNITAGKRLVGTIPPSDENGAWYGYVCGEASFGQTDYGVAVLFDSGQELTKQNTHELKLGAEWTIARA